MAVAGAGLSGCGLTRAAPASDPDASAFRAPEGVAQMSLAAALHPRAGESELGNSVASLGDPTLGGFWVRTPLVTHAVKGRVVNKRSGASVQVDLLPMPSGGNDAQMSLATMRLLTPSLTDLPEVALFAG
ncbi:hypothetical protein [Paenirhodobacter populi]|uniref:D-galactarate dehydratase n=1 Tax=Paenirhodobacter populi TaxID=2306993 RepID=A0A443IUM4_9RHOB|nr:hypothetical protein [Sinirhodobacter populi]RWR04754.1 hypothetical protein D2T32_18615 [Sinirhodobacter populi]RWR11798.1 hypothetical protein D2T33_11235 [Sinirhodobacter populi]